MLLFSTAQAATLEYKYTSVLDAFLTKLETYQDNLAYVQLLDTFLTELNKLKPNYSSTGKVPAMIEYLVAGVDELKTKAFYKAIAGVFDPLESSSS
ncbi:MAG: hypothetical protein LBC61_05130 [Candidatus Peribacteria bacterium]|nr:hypothetical protein [Candidatus Peribacteria bacterium]